MEHNPFELSAAQVSNSPDDFWKGFLGQKVTKLANLLEKTGDVFEPSVQEELEKALNDVPENRQEFVSKNELLLRALEWYAKEGNGFANEKLEQEYVGIVANELLGRFREYDFDAVSTPLQEEIDMIVKEKGIPLRSDSVESIRNLFWERFSALKTEEYGE